ncbi:hypothetical protein DESAMIL20_384 [Desulfurella amilsii]|uniref:Uncharacterized protein n=1 Tax=Desulfurella amilsii TaxID=1562698 RepID=A0A1X4XZ15_9BACT|nr:hypothetical protein DESAMIL20_460 [Desulfurella amilsii]OSS42840.1 hypothetical protein DESAMIL20_384 [Desulfurella amilsii]
MKKIVYLVRAMSMLSVRKKSFCVEFAKNFIDYCQRKRN